MKEVKEWDNKPRYMWVWDAYEESMRKEYVVYVFTDKEKMKNIGAEFPVRTLNSCYKHCAEIEEPTKRPCTMEELFVKLKKQGLPMLKTTVGNLCFTIDSMSDNNVYIGSENQSYEGLCRCYTLLDGTPLWVEQ